MQSLRILLAALAVLLAPAAAAAQTPPTGDDDGAEPADTGADTAGAPAVPDEPTPAPETAPEAEAAPAPAASVDAPPPKKLAVGKSGTWQPGLLAQAWFILDRADPPATTTFRIRRAELAVKGEILPGQVAYQVMFDPARVRDDAPAPISVLQDFYTTYLSQYAEVSVGQFKIPVSWEGYNSSSKLLLPERALVSKQFGDKRDLGIRVAKTMPRWGFSAGVFNGTGLDKLDTDNSKDVGLRLEAYPVPGLVIAGVGYATIGHRDRDGAKDRFEGDVRYEHGPLLLQGEFIRARDVVAGADVNAQGFYAAAAYMVDKLQPVVRVGMLDPNVDADSDQTVHVDAGVNYYLDGHDAKVQAVYSRFEPGTGTGKNEVILATQVHF